MKGISIIICCYNSVSRLYETLEHLALQITAPSLAWEIILVDNASTDNTIAFATETWNKLNRTNVDFKIVSEKKQGLSFARQRGVYTAKYEYIIFCDDDNWLREDYVQTASNIIDNDITIGAMGGENIAVSNTGLPGWFTRCQEFYAVGKPAETSGYVNSRSYVCGAGMVTRKSVFQNAINNKLPSILSDRKGNALSSGGDVEYCLRILLQGYNLYFSENLVLQHFIPAARLTETYKTALSSGIDESRKTALEYAEAIKIKNLNKRDKVAALMAAVKDVLKSFIRRRKPQPFSYKLFFYLFNIGYNNRSDLKIIKQFYNA